MSENNEPEALAVGNPTDRRRLTAWFETGGSLLAMAYALLIASNSGYEVLGFALLAASALLFAAWAVLDRRWTFLLLQAFYLFSALLGLWRWS